MERFQNTVYAVLLLVSVTFVKIVVSHSISVVHVIPNVLDLLMDLNAKS